MEDREVILEQGLDLQKLMAGGAEFKIDQAFKGPKIKYDPMLDDGDFNSDQEDSDVGDNPDTAEKAGEMISTLLLNAPGDVSFGDMAQKMVDVIPSGDIKMHIISEGDGPLVPEGARVWVHYAMYWENETVSFDTTLIRDNAFLNPAFFTLGVGKLLPAIEQCIMSLRGPQASAQFLLSHKVTWGEFGHPPRIPGGKTCLLCLKLMDVQDIGAIERFEKLENNERQHYTKAMKTFEIGNKEAKDLFIKSRYNQAIKMYHRCLNILRFCIPKDEMETELISEKIVKTLINLAVCYNKLEMSNKAILMINELGNVTNLNSNSKALYQYALAHESIGELEEACYYYTKAYQKEPMNSEIANKLYSLQAQLSSYKDAESAMWKTAFKTETEKKASKLDPEVEEFVNYACQCIQSGDRTRFEIPPEMYGNDIGGIRTIVDRFEGLTLLQESEPQSVNCSRFTIAKG